MLATLLLAVMLAAPSGDQCTMQAPPLEVERIKREATIRAVVAEKSGRALSALLKDGTQLRVETMGCEHAGMNAALWLKVGVRSNKDSMLAGAVNLSKLAFGQQVTRELEAAIKAGSYTTKTEPAGLFISIQQPDGIYFGIKEQPVATGSMLYVEYIYP